MTNDGQDSHISLQLCFVDAAVQDCDGLKVSETVKGCTLAAIGKFHKHWKARAKQGGDIAFPVTNMLR